MHAAAIPENQAVRNSARYRGAALHTRLYGPVDEENRNARCSGMLVTGLSWREPRLRVQITQVAGARDLRVETHGTALALPQSQISTIIGVAIRALGRGLTEGRPQGPLPREEGARPGASYEYWSRHAKARPSAEPWRSAGNGHVRGSE